MRSVQIQKVYDAVAKIEKETAVKLHIMNVSFDKRLHRSVMVWMDDGCIFYWNNCFVETYENEDGTWYVIRPEHHDTLVYHKDDVEYIKQFKAGEIDITKIKP